MRVVKELKIFIVNGGWSEWTKVVDCNNLTVRGNWTQTVQRSCVNPAPMFGGLPCYQISQIFIGNETEKLECPPSEFYSLKDVGCFCSLN